MNKNQEQKTTESETIKQSQKFYLLPIKSVEAKKVDGLAKDLTKLANSLKCSEFVKQRLLNEAKHVNVSAIYLQREQDGLGVGKKGIRNGTRNNKKANCDELLKELEAVETISKKK